MEKDLIIKNIFKNGVKCFNKKDFYSAHELFEDIWVNYKVDDRLFIQSLIQLSVAYFHISNINKNGAVGLFRKSIQKLNSYRDKYVIISNINEVIDASIKSFKVVQDMDDIKLFNWELAPKLKIRNE